MCPLSSRQWSEKNGQRTAQINYLLNNTGPVGICGITVDMPSWKNATVYWPAWINTTRMPELFEPNQVWRGTGSVSSEQQADMHGLNISPCACWQIVEIGANVPMARGYPNVTLSPSFWECKIGSWDVTHA